MRADKFFAERFGSRTKAAAALRRGLILRDGVPLSPDDEVKDGQSFVFLEREEQFVSEGGYKLARGLDFFRETPTGVFVDLGASTGGFCDCLLQRGAVRVYCVDVGENQLDKKISSDPRAVVRDRTNARYLQKSDFPETIDGVVSDLSFISLKLVLPAIADILKEGGKAFLLFKPQFECGGKGLNKQGILPVRCHAPLLKDFYESLILSGLAPLDIVNAPLREKKNVEYVVYGKKGGQPVSADEFLTSAARFL